jgi:hypothetical protein
MSLVDEAAAGAVKKGMDTWLYGIGDSMVNLNGNGTLDSAARQETPGLILRMLSFTIDPFRGSTSAAATMPHFYY